MATIPTSSAKEDTRAGRTCRLNTLSAVQMTAILIRLRTTRARGAVVQTPPGGEKQLVVEILDLPDGTVEIEAGALPGPGRLPETSPKRLAFEQAGERVREVRRVARLDEETLHAVFDDLR